MGWFLNRSVSGKLFIGFALILAVLAAVIIMAKAGIAELEDSISMLHERIIPSLVTSMELRVDEHRGRTIVFQLMLTKSPEQQAKLIAELNDRKTQIEAGVEAIKALNVDNPSNLQRLAELRSTQDAFMRTREQIVGLIKEGKVDEALNLALGVQDERFEHIRTLVRGFVEDDQKIANAQVSAAEASVSRLSTLMFILGAFACACTIGVILLLNRYIARPLTQLVDVADRISEGDLTVKLPMAKGADEVAALTRAFIRMKENLWTVNMKIKESVTVLGSTSREIAAITSQSASGATETATSVSETTSTVEEVKQTAQVSTQKAKAVSDAARRSAEIAQNGSASVNAMAEGMRGIRVQMESIAQSVVRLSEQGQTIGEIIAAVDDLAEQSNLLAVNAAIEAARAGEQGKGFNVVAQEVKSLAEQSKRATSQVRGILGDIQKATSAAVMATEQGSKAVESGVQQSAAAEQAIRQLAEGLSEAAQAAAQIAASSQQQLVGMDQVAVAMENINKASVQNAAGAKQSEEAAISIRALGEDLAAAVEQFKV